MNQNNQQLESTSMVQGNEDYLNLNSLWMKYVDDAEYEFGLTLMSILHILKIVTAITRVIRIYMPCIYLQPAESWLP